MPSNVDVCNHVLYKLRNAGVKKWPFPHFYAENVFPDYFYHEIAQKVADKDGYSAAKGRYEGRTFGHVADIPGLEFMTSKEFLQGVVAIFPHEMKGRYPDGGTTVYTDTRLVRDHFGYEIGPHTDAEWKIVSLLFYLPQTTDYARHGTAIYVPKDPAIRCPGGPHHDPDHFKCVWTAPYLPNTCFGFFKTDASFHGVAPVDEHFDRNVLLYNIHDEGLYLHSHKSISGEESHGNHQSGGGP